MIDNVLESVWKQIIDTKYEAYYQPQYSSVTHEIKGFEALARLNNDNGIISPANFIYALEKDNMISNLDTFIFESICKFLGKCKANNLKEVPVSINLSRYDFYDKDFINELEEIRKKHNINPKLINIEITDALEKESISLAKDIINEFQKYGYRVLLDNYDGAKTIESFIHDVPYDGIKLDLRKLDADFNQNSGKKIAQIIKDAQKLSLHIVAQGVETIEQANFIKDNGCENVQGYYYSRPTNQDNALNVLKLITNDFSISTSSHRSYKEKFNNLLDQIDGYYFEYIVSTKEVFPCERSIKLLGLQETMPNCPDSIVDLGIIDNTYIESFKAIFTRISKGESYIEEQTKLANNEQAYLIRSTTEFDNSGNPVEAHCSIIKK